MIYFSRKALNDLTNNSGNRTFAPFKSPSVRASRLPEMCCRFRLSPAPQRGSAKWLLLRAALGRRGVSPAARRRATNCSSVAPSRSGRDYLHSPLFVFGVSARDAPRQLTAQQSWSAKLFRRINKRLSDEYATHSSRGAAATFKRIS